MWGCSTLEYLRCLTWPSAVFKHASIYTGNGVMQKWCSVERDLLSRRYLDMHFLPPRYVVVRLILNAILMWHHFFIIRLWSLIIWNVKESNITAHCALWSEKAFHFLVLEIDKIFICTKAVTLLHKAIYWISSSWGTIRLL